MISGNMLAYILRLLLLAQLTLTARSRLNILFILTDDQDWHMESVDHMKNLKVRLPTALFPY